MTKEKTLIALIFFLVGMGTLLAAVAIFDIDLVRWVNCSAPFAAPIDKKSEICR